jgi:hypothetical protein
VRAKRRELVERDAAAGGSRGPDRPRWSRCRRTAWPVRLLRLPGEVTVQRTATVWLLLLLMSMMMLLLLLLMLLLMLMLLHRGAARH